MIFLFDLFILYYIPALQQRAIHLNINIHDVLAGNKFPRTEFDETVLSFSSFFSTFQSEEAVFRHAILVLQVA